MGKVSALGVMAVIASFGGHSQAKAAQWVDWKESGGGYEILIEDGRYVADTLREKSSKVVAAFAPALRLGASQGAKRAAPYAAGAAAGVTAPAWVPVVVTVVTVGSLAYTGYEIARYLTKE